MFETSLRIRCTRPNAGYEDYVKKGTAMKTANPTGITNQPAKLLQAPGASRLRITRRGYALLTLLIAAPLVVGAFGLAVNGGAATASSEVATVVFERVTVGAGQSLWQLAAQIAPTADPRDVIVDIVRLNDLSSASLQAGQSLAIPKKYTN